MLTSTLNLLGAVSNAWMLSSNANAGMSPTVDALLWLRLSRFLFDD